MSTPLEATRSSPISTTIRDCLVQAWVVTNDSAPSDAGAWMIDVGGHELVGPAVDRVRHESLHDVKDMLREWAKEHPTLFD
jgi:hypothetical protein